MQPPAIFTDYPALLTFGFHKMTPAQLRTLCVDSFPRSVARPEIMSNLERIVTALESAKIQGNLWVDGSFVTKKNEPGDVDLLLHVEDGRGFDLANPDHAKAFLWLNSNLKQTHLCDSYVNAIPARPHPMHDFLTDHLKYWQRQFGYSRGTISKGIAVLPIGGGI